MAPPVTPSPRRFILKGRSRDDAGANTTSSSSKPSVSSQFPDAPARRLLKSLETHHGLPPAVTAVPSTLPASQFVGTPKFIPRITQLSAEALPSSDHLAKNLSFDSIDDLSQNEDQKQDITELPHPKFKQANLTDQQRSFDSITDDEFAIHQSKVKRLRLSSDAQEPSASTVTTQNPSWRFLTAEPTTQALSINVQPPIHRPAFMLPPEPQEQQDHDPLPSYFSPQRKSQRFVPGGLAAVMRSHIMSVTSAASHLPQGSGFHERGWKLQVLSTINFNLTIVQGVKEDGVEHSFLLVGNGSKLHSGDVIRVDGLAWDTQICGEVYIVCIDWKIESSTI